jgi:hypothetical protein
MVSLEDAKTKAPDRKNSKHIIISPRGVGPPPQTEPNQVAELMKTFQETLVTMQRKEDAQRREMERLQAMVTAIQQPAQQDGNTPKTTSSSLPPSNILYDVALGRGPESVSVHTFTTAETEVKGFPGAVWCRVASVEEGWEFIANYQEQQLLAPPNVTDPIRLDPPPVTTSSLQTAIQSLTAPRVSEHDPVDGFSRMGGRAVGPDPSQKTEGKIFNLLFTEENTLRLGLVPHPQTMAPQVQAHLMGQAPDVTMLPYSVASPNSESLDSSAALSRALASMAGTQTDLELGGDPMDLNWKANNKISVASIKNLSQLRERLTELRQGKHAIEQTLLGRITSVLQHAGYEQTLASEWAINSILYRMGCDSQSFYVQLHEHILDKVWDDESACDFDNAKLEIEHHAAELRRLCTMYSSRIMMVCAIYAYLRDQSASNFRSAKLQEKRQKLQLTAMKKQLAQVENTFQKMKELSNKQANNDNSNGRKNKPMCWKCHQAGIHTGGKDNCLWKNLGDEEAKAKALEWVAAKQAQIRN